MPLRAQDEPLWLVREGKPEARIVVAAQPAPLASLKDASARNAAELLRDYIEQATGARLAIVSDEEVGDTPGSLLLVGDTAAGRQRGLSPAGLPPEGYRLSRFDGGAAIVGEVTAEGLDRGTAFGVYDFLERVAGVRWYFPGEIGTVVPKHTALSVGPLDVTRAPHFEVRFGGVGHWSRDAARAWHPVLRFGMRDGLVANHTHELWHELFGAAHPEYFGIRKDGTRAITDAQYRSGQNKSYLCYSEPGVLRQHVADIDDYARTGNAKAWRGAAARPNGRHVPFGPSDNRDICLCDACRAATDLDRGRWGKGSNLIFTFVRDLGKEVQAAHPDIRIWSLAYDHYQLPPTRVTELPDTIAITLCLIPTVVQMNHPGVRARNREVIDRWFDLVGRDRTRLIVWDYFCYPNTWFVAPTENVRTLKDHVHYLKDKALGIFNNGFNPERQPRPSTYLTYRIVWLMHQLLWNPELDLAAARRQWCADLFGPAAKDMDRFYERLEDRWEGVTWAQQPQNGFVSEKSIYGETYPPDVVDELETLLDAACTRAAGDDDAQKRLTWFRTNAFGPFFRAAREFHGSMREPSQANVTRTDDPLEADGQLDEAAWRAAPPLALADRRFGAAVTNAAEVRVCADTDRLYIGAQLCITNAGGTVARAEGRENSAVEEDDMFLIHLQPPDAEGYLELAVNPGGSFSSRADVINKRGFFPSHPMLAWDTDEVRVACRTEGDTWFVEVAVPWRALPGGAARPDVLRAQFIRWMRTDAHHFHCWSPTLSSWDYPLERFGRLVIGATAQSDRGQD